MNDDYLWDKSGTPDPELLRLERALSPLRRQAHRASSSPPERPRWPRVLAAAALLGVAVLLALAPSPARPDVALADYRIEGVCGRPLVTDPRGAPRRHGQPIYAGDRIECGAGAQARVEVGDIGHVVLEEKSALRVEQGATAEEDVEGSFRLFLERGTLSASIFAAPRIFQVGTPSGIAVDLGCVYTATVRDDGGTTLRVVSGAVSFESDGRRVYVPSGAECVARPRRGPGTPVWSDAPDPWKDAVSRVDTTRRLDGESADRLLASSTPRDTLALWHLLTVVDATDDRRRLLDHIAALVPLDEAVDRNAALALDPDALEALRDHLDWEW